MLAHSLLGEALEEKKKKKEMTGDDALHARGMGFRKAGVHAGQEVDPGSNWTKRRKETSAPESAIIMRAENEIRDEPKRSTKADCHGARKPTIASTALHHDVIRAPRRGITSYKARVKKGNSPRAEPLKETVKKKAGGVEQMSAGGRQI